MFKDVVGRRAPRPSALACTRRSARQVKERMKRTVFEVALAAMVIVLGLEVVHYRNAVLDCNVDRKRAWGTVVELRERNKKSENPTTTLPRP